MGRILFFVLFALLVYVAIRRIFAKHARDDDYSREETRPGSAKKISGEKMVQCEHCGVYVSESECVKRGGHYFCSDDHARKGVKTL